MGGNALKNYGVKRVDRETFERIKEYVLETLSDVLDVARVPLFLDNKKDFGDLDILAVLKPPLDPVKVIKERFNPRGLIRNGNVISFNVEDLQVDLITTRKENFDIYYSYLCWGDLGMIIGRLSRLWDLKYGIYGLEMSLRDPHTNHVVTTLSISKDFKSILEFLGYDYNRWNKGFKSFEEVRDFAFSSQRIHRGFLTADSENTKHRKRDQQDRKMYMEMYKWFSENRERFPNKADLEIPKTIDEKINHIQNYFSDLSWRGMDLKTQYYSVIDRVEKSKAAREKFCGVHIQKMFPNVKGKDFGNIMKKWNSQFETKEEQIDFVLNHSIEYLKANVYKILENE